MGLLFFIFMCIAILSAVTLYIGISFGNKTPLDKVMYFFLAYVIFHVIHAALFRLLPLEYRYVDRASPLGFLYGPLLYFDYLTSQSSILKLKTILIHSTPLFIGLCFYIFFLINYSSYFRANSSLYYTCLYAPMALSWLGYPIYIAYQGTVNKEKEGTTKHNVLSIAIIILFTLAFFLVLSVWGRLTGTAAAAVSSSLIIFSGMLGGVIIVFWMVIQQLKEKINAVRATELLVGQNEEDVVSTYVKSGLNNEEFENYAQKVNDYLSSKKYLDPNLNLNTLSSDLKIPKHYLSQVFSQYYGKSFLKHINSLRILHACDILEDPNFNSNIDDLVELCGFNSKTSFYRNFKEIAQMTPSEFLNGSAVEKVEE
jgi:AraC-like DNA-binding protein